MAAQMMMMDAQPGAGGTATVPPVDTWMEAKTAEGKSYYYHSVTRQTSWTLPAGAVLLQPPPQQPIQQPEVSSVSLANNNGGGASVTPTSTSPTVVAHNAMAQAQAASQFGAQPASLTSSGQVVSTPFSISQQPPPNFTQHPPPHLTGLPPPMSFSPANMMNPNMPPPGMFGMPPPGMGFSPFGQFMPQAMMAPVMVMPRGDPADWTEYTTDDGRSYWYNSKLSRTTWDKPPEVAEFESKKLLESETQKQENKTAVDNKKDASTKPIATKQIPGTPWCVVWTSDRKCFFHNPSTKSSVWKRPADLLGMKEADEIVAMNPDDVTAAAATSETSDKAAVGSGISSDGGGGDESVTAASAYKRHAADNLDGHTTKRQRGDGLDDTTSRDSFSDGGSGEVSQPSSTSRPAYPRHAPVQKEKPKDPAYEAELKAAKDRERIPLESRIITFKELLAEKDVSAFSTWEKELPKIVFDARYLLLTSKERRDVFDEFTRDKTEREREEKKRKIEEVREAFRALLREAVLTSKVSFGEFSTKHKTDERVRAMDRIKEREQLFEDHIASIRRQEKEQRQAEREKISELNRKSHWGDIKKKVRDDARYERVDSSNQREEWFRDYIKTLSSKKKDKESDEEAKPEEGEESENENTRRDREKQERMDASIRERERQVQEELTSISKDREKERQHHQQDEAVQHYRALLVDLIRQTDMTYKEARKVLKKDARYELAEPLHKHQKEDLYEEHLDMLSAKKKQAYRDLLEETDVTLDASWKEVRRKIRDDPRFSKYSSSDSKSEKEFHRFLRDKTAKAKEEFYELLKETKLLDYKTKSRIEESGEQTVKDFIEILKNDKRYLVLDPLSSERKAILAEYIDELAKRGPPPPPTASEPSRRGK